MNVYIVYNIVYKNSECLYFRGGGRIDKNIINNIIHIIPQRTNSAWNLFKKTKVCIYYTYKPVCINNIHGRLKKILFQF